jgi:hypothetical protein
MPDGKVSERLIVGETEEEDIVMSREAAKQLMFELAEFFGFELVPITVPQGTKFN